MEKKKVLGEQELKELPLPDQAEILGRIIKHSGGDLLIVKCIDGRTRLCRIRGN